MAKSSARLKLLYLASPSLPIGAYAYSQGQEYAVDADWLKNPDDLFDWILGVLEHAQGSLDVPVLARLYQCFENQDWTKAAFWNQYLIASRETKELLLEDEQLALALQRLLQSQGHSEEMLEVDEKIKTQGPISYLTLYALAGVIWEIELEELQEAYLWSWAENQIAAATKAVPLGQTVAQQLLMRLLDKIPSVISASKVLEDEDIGASLPGLAIASSLHERQYSRLFRS